MKTQKDDIDSFIDALRGDLPSEHDEARVRARLIASGVLVAASAVTSGVAAAGTAGAAGSIGSAAPAGLVKVGFFSKVLALPMATKVGAATTVAVALAAGVPIALEASPAVQAPAESRTSPAVQAPQARRAPEVSEPLGGAPRATDATTRPASMTTKPLEPTPPQAATPPRVTAAAPSKAHLPAERAPSRPRTAPASELATQVKPAASTLAEETHLMERAMAALGEGDRENAGYWLAEHDRRFPRGLLTRERVRTLERLRQMATSKDPSAPAP
jgi:hypothetical protein